MTIKKDKPFKIIDRRASSMSDSDSTFADSPVPSKPSYVTVLERQLKEKDEKIKQLTSLIDSSPDDIETAKSRIKKEMNKEVAQNKKSIIYNFLDIIDNLDKALEAVEQTHNAQSVVEGVYLIRDMFVEKLRLLGVHKVEALGTRFDPNKHEALTLVPTQDPVYDGQVVDVIKEGYTIDEEILRPASVAVGDASPT